MIQWILILLQKLLSIHHLPKNMLGDAHTTRPLHS